MVSISRENQRVNGVHTADPATIDTRPCRITREGRACVDRLNRRPNEGNRYPAQFWNAGRWLNSLASRSAVNTCVMSG